MQESALLSISTPSTSRMCQRRAMQILMVTRAGGMGSGDRKDIFRVLAIQELSRVHLGRDCALEAGHTSVGVCVPGQHHNVGTGICSCSRSWHVG
mmetsp:Transcript_55300/g.102350  ORF Transcript_55300/g.102350 Transcript_55300/m.102350 type:complete len:95 (+) Transcript_55300:774-1058(+)